MQKTLPELLAPAGSPEAFSAAIAAGADAVYLGGKRFGARQYAGNFDNAGIEEAVAGAHARGVKVYVTVNTLIHDRELAGALEYLVWLYSTGVDAVLVQDLGFAALARSVVPDLPLHASTQMTIHSAEGVRAAAAMGLSRVVLARELTLPEIEAIAKVAAGSNIGLEIFAHGALCFCYSGQCLLSSVIGGRSGNRGMCAQPCRKPYALVTGRTDAYGRPGNLREVPSDGEYLLSPRDLCTYARLDRIVRSPVVSLKIEGRMKSPEYVAIVTAAYRQALDAIAEGREPDQEGAMEDLALAFNRGFTDGYLFKRRHSAVMGRTQPDNRGVLIGSVGQYRQETGEALIDLSGRITPVAGDGLFIAGPGGKATGVGFSLNTSPARQKDRILLRVPGRVRPGSEVFLTSGVALAAKARRILAGDYPDLRHPVPVDIGVTVDEDGFVEIEGRIVTKDRGVPVRYRSDVALVPARTRPLPAESLLESLKKTGGTPFSLRSAGIRYAGNLFAPVSAINRMRREFLARAEEALAASFRPKIDSLRAAEERLAAVLPSLSDSSGTGTMAESTWSAALPQLVLYTDSLAGVNAAAESGCDGICFEPDLPDPSVSCRCRTGNEDTDLGPEGQIRAAIAACRNARIPLTWKLPRITRQAWFDWYFQILLSLKKEGLDTCMAGTLDAVSALRARCPGIPVIASDGLNIFNHRSACCAAQFCKSLTLSPELSGEEIAELIRRTRNAGCMVPFALVVQGTAEAMVAENCILEPVRHCGASGKDSLQIDTFTGLKDSTGHVFPVRSDASCRTHILNADETCLIDHLPAILRAGIGTIAIDARGRPPAYIREMVRIYRDGLRIAGGVGRDTQSDLDFLKQQVRAFAIGKITAGHVLRGLKEA